MNRRILTSVSLNMVKLWVPLLVALCFFPPSMIAAQDTAQGESGGAEDPVALFEQANIAHTRGDYEQAVIQYTAIILKNGASDSLLCNLAGSYAADGRIGLAVLNYERALRLAPGDSAVQADLEQVRKDAGLYRDDRPLYERLAALLGADQWLMLFGFAFLLLAVSALAVNLGAGRARRRDGILHLITFGSLMVMILTLFPALLRYQAWNDGVVVREDVRLLISPFAESASAGGIKTGRVVRPGRAHGDYVLVEDETGRSGWLAQGDFQLIAELPNG